MRSSEKNPGPTKKNATGRWMTGALLSFPLGIVAARKMRNLAMSWGSTPAELEADLPGDDLVDPVDRAATRSITIDASEAQVWPWLVQLGQGRGGFYSYDVLENLIGLDIHSADRIEERWQGLAPGDKVSLAEGMELEVAILEPRRALVLQGGELPDEAPAPDFDFSWAFVVRALPDGRTRLIVRERYAWKSMAAVPVVSIAMWMSALMTRRMLMGIKERAERR
ncbi:hypothetical protein VR010_03635 [Actinomycetaceae bacterium L2_0104]